MSSSTRGRGRNSKLSSCDHGPRARWSVFDHESRPLQPTRLRTPSKRPPAQTQHWTRPVVQPISFSSALSLHKAAALVHGAVTCEVPSSIPLTWYDELRLAYAHRSTTELRGILESYGGDRFTGGTCWTEYGAVRATAPISSSPWTSIYESMPEPCTAADAVCRFSSAMLFGREWCRSHRPFRGRSLDWWGSRETGDQVHAMVPSSWVNTNRKRLGCTTYLVWMISGGVGDRQSGIRGGSYIKC